MNTRITTSFHIPPASLQSIPYILLISLVHKITSSSSGGWLSDNDLNKDRLDLFYWLLAALSLINFFNYLFCSKCGGAI
uniref:Uncharacterized protein n=1 Tax=Quercus lobata TaxID=97700 RepID=A0A7N2KQU1_QUELO